ncbi:MAG: hypothetical protein CMG71_00305 [Candidatus Marinimicrobia bacterium]|nr:hypothetical protein [Candidatus Neomarinimicrobiota bacterium]|tara:strand:+ start:12058 stop:13575 length:1518 start_codon:yes stop_codon:yes gene_type:complete
MKIDRIALLSLSLILLTGCAQEQDVPLPVTSSSVEAVEHFNTGRKHSSNHDFLLQPQYFKKALALDPDFVLANLWINEPDPSKWAVHRQKAIDNKGKVSDAERILVEMAVAQREDRLTDAVRLGEELIEKYPNSSDSYVYLGNAIRGVNDFDGAEDNYRKALEINPKNLRALWQLTSHHMNVYIGQVMRPKEEQDRTLARKYIDKMIEVSPDAGSFLQMRGNLLRAQSDFENAKEWYSRALESRESQNLPKAGILGVIAHNLLFNGEVEEAHEFYNRSIAASVRPGQKIGQWNFKLQAYLFVGDYSGAVEAADNVLAEMDGFGFSEAALYQNMQAIEFRKFLAEAHNQNREKAYKSMNSLASYRAKENSLLAEDDIRERNFKIGDVQNHAWFYLLFGEYDKAESKLEELYAIVSKIESPTALIDYRAMKGMIALSTGNPAEALDYMDDNIDTENYQYYSYYKGLALKALDRNEEARSIFQALANYNFNSWGASLVRTLAQKQLAS